MKDIVQLAKGQSGTVYQVLNQSSHLIWWADTRGHILIGNDPIIDHMGFKSLDEVQGIHYSAQRTEGGQFHETWAAQDQRTMELQRPLRILSYVKAPHSDQRVLIYGVKHPAFDEEGNPVGTVNHCYDVTGYHELSWLPLLCQNDRGLVTVNGQGAFAYTIVDHFESRKNRIRLTERQSDCLFLAIRGLTAKEIAALLTLSKRTVESHLDAVRMRLDCESRSALIEKAITLGFAELIPEGHLSRLMNLPNHVNRCTSYHPTRPSRHL